MRRSLITLISVALVLGACGGDSDDADPAETIEAYVEAYNAGDVDAIGALFANDAVITGHPGGNYSGNAEIRALHEEEADGTVAYVISNVTIDGNTVRWDHKWGEVDDDGNQIEGFCVEGHTAEIDSGKIVSWTWPITDFQC